MRGFKIVTPFRYLGENKRPKYPIEGNYNMTGWVFFTWDNASRKYVMVEEVDPGEAQERQAPFDTVYTQTLFWTPLPEGEAYSRNVCAIPRNFCKQFKKVLTNV
jgi:hypothetical protein